MPPLWRSEIRDFRIDPVKNWYGPKEPVVFLGRLWIDKFGWGPAPDGRKIVIYTDMVKTPFEGVTDRDGFFKIVAELPTTPGVYSYRAHFIGHDWFAAEDGCWSPTILTKVITPGLPTPPPPVVPPPVPPVPPVPPWVLLLVGGAIIGVIIWKIRR